MRMYNINMCTPNTYDELYKLCAANELSSASSDRRTSNEIETIHPLVKALQYPGKLTDALFKSLVRWLSS